MPLKVIIGFAAVLVFLCAAYLWWSWPRSAHDEAVGPAGAPEPSMTNPPRRAYENTPGRARNEDTNTEKSALRPDVDADQDATDGYAERESDTREDKLGEAEPVQDPIDAWDVEQVGDGWPRSESYALSTLVDTALTEHGGELLSFECRDTVCRTAVAFADIPTLIKWQQQVVMLEGGWPAAASFDTPTETQDGRTSINSYFSRPPQGDTR